MSEPTLQDLFGTGATQTATTITILKSDLPMSASNANRAEQILAAMLKNASVKLTAATFATNIDQSVTIASGFEQLVYRTLNNTTTAYLQTPLTVNFAKAQTSSGITPDEY
jgi:hypothetical protein